MISTRTSEFALSNLRERPDHHVLTFSLLERPDSEDDASSGPTKPRPDHRVPSRGTKAFINRRQEHMTRTLPLTVPNRDEHVLGIRHSPIFRQLP